MGKRLMEAERITIEVPKAVMDFLRAHVKNPEEYLSERLIPAIDADLQTNDHPFFDYENLVKLYNLKQIFDC
jgi:hypothetical protein